MNTEILIRDFENANYRFIRNNKTLFDLNVSERCLCGALMMEIYNLIKENNNYNGYYVDVEFNRNKNGIVKK